MVWGGATTAWSDFETYLYFLLLQRGNHPVTYSARAFGWKEFCRHEWFKAPGQDLLSAKAFKQTLETREKKKKFSSLSKLNAFPRGKKKSNLGPICDPFGVSPRRSLAQRAQR